MLHVRNLLALLVTTALAMGACQQQPAEETGEMTTPEAVDPAAEQAAIEAAFDGITADYGTHDAAVLAAYYTDDAVWIADDEPNTVGRESIQQAITQRFTEMPDVAIDIQPEEIVVSSSGDLAIAYGTYTLSGTRDGAAAKDSRKFVTSHRKMDGEWKITGVIWNGAGPDPVAEAAGAETTAP